MRKRMGRPAKHAAGDSTTITIRIPTDMKNLIVDVADGYDMTITEYLLTLVQRDVSEASTSQ
jgi:antitoxin component of RelBE/YafQ-DinJ toxin-antitoxin module